MSRWRRDSEFGPGLRVPLCREQRARFLALLNLHRRPGQLTPAAREVGRVLAGLLGEDGRCDPGIDTIARLAGFGRSAVIEGLARLRALGFLTWTRRLVRDAATAWRAEQTSNAYALRVPTTEMRGPAGVAWRVREAAGSRSRIIQEESGSGTRQRVASSVRGGGAPARGSRRAGAGGVAADGLDRRCPALRCPANLKANVSEYLNGPR